MSEGLYYAAESSAFTLGPSGWIYRIRGGASTAVIDAFAARVLRVCRGARSLNEHATAAEDARLGGDSTAVRAALDHLVAVNLLRRVEFTFNPTGQECAQRPRTISTVSIITANRPNVLRRCLEVVAAYSVQCQYQPAVVIIDGSSHHAVRDANNATVAALAHRTGRNIRYFGAAEATAYHQDLRDAGIGSSDLPFGFTPGATGANRNLATLLTAGHDFVTLDDDIVFTPWATAGNDDDVEFGGHDDLREWRFFESRANALAAIRPSAVDLFREHARLLGTGVGDLFARGRPVHVKDACGHLMGAIVLHRPCRIRLTFPGIAGDSGVYCPSGLLFIRGKVRELLMSDRAALETALASREVHRVALRHVVTHEANCMGGCMGLANRTLLPPFMPLGRNEDGVFGATLAFMDRTALFVHLPYGVIHASQRPAAYGRRQMLHATQTRLSDLMFAVIRLASESTMSGPDADRLRRLGREFSALGGLQLGSFVARVAELVLAHCCQRLAQVEEGERQGSSDWQVIVSSYRELFRLRVAEDDFFLPIEFRHHRSTAEGFEALRIFIQDFGRWLDAWPAIWQAAERVNYVATWRTS